MKLLKQLRAYNKQEAEGTIFGFGILRARDYKREVYGHLLLFSFNIKVVKVIKKLFIPI